MLKTIENKIVFAVAANSSHMINTITMGKLICTVMAIMAMGTTIDAASHRRSIIIGLLSERFYL